MNKNLPNLFKECPKRQKPPVKNGQGIKRRARGGTSKKGRKGKKLSKKGRKGKKLNLDLAETVRDGRRRRKTTAQRHQTTAQSRPGHCKEVQKKVEQKKKEHKENCCYKQLVSSAAVARTFSPEAQVIASMMV